MSKSIQARQQGSSEDAGSAAPALPGITRIDRMPPPAELDDDAQCIWRDVIACRPADWMTLDLAPLLVDYCCHVVRQREIRQLIAQLKREEDSFDLKSYAKLCQVEAAQTRTISAVAVKLGIAQYQRSEPKREGKGVLRPPHLG